MVSLSNRKRIGEIDERIADLIEERNAVWQEASEESSDEESGGLQADTEKWDEIADERGWEPAATRAFTKALDKVSASAGE
ncbi:MAG: hypothetical protein JWM56_1154 [Candidatus Peribacteria bacterium]|nr:hypothetical protein [Candidatus Peribacteria bacterium]